jgi:hypothetical protein
MLRLISLVLPVLLMLWPSPAVADDEITKPADKADAEATEGFRSVGFYLHAGWVYRHPFAVRSWTPEDYAGMFQLLKGFGYDRVMMWPVVEAIPMPLSDADRASLVAFRDTIDAARTAGLEAWFVQAANLTTDPSVAAKPWRDRVFPAGAKTIRLDDPAQAAIEFEPSIPQAKLQLDLIRANLAEESRWAGTVRGVFGNAQQPLMVLPNIRFFAQAARNPAYRSATDEQILRDLAEALGGPADLLVPAWQCMTLPLDRLPAYPAGRSVTLKSSPRRLRASGASSCRRASRRKIGTGAN